MLKKIDVDIPWKTFTEMNYLVGGYDPVRVAQGFRAAGSYKECVICRKQFFITGGFKNGYEYKLHRYNGTLWFCSWKCLNVYENMNHLEKRPIDARVKKY